MKIDSVLRKLGACESGANWADSQPNYREAWQSCERGDWMLWIAKRKNVDVKKLTMAKVECAELVKHLMTDQRSIDALVVARRFANGLATREELNDAAGAAAAAADAAADAAAYAADADAADAADAAAAGAAAYAADADADAAAAADAAADAADAAAYAAAAADAAADAADAAAYAADADAAAKQDTLKKAADLIRKHIGFEDLGIEKKV